MKRVIPVDETLGQRIRRKRKARQLSLREMARRLDVSAPYLSQVEINDETSPPSEAKLREIASLLEDDFDSLMHLAGKVPSDIIDMLKKDPHLPQFLRAASDHGFTGEDLVALLEASSSKKQSQRG